MRYEAEGEIYIGNDHSYEQAGRQGWVKDYDGVCKVMGACGGVG